MVEKKRIVLIEDEKDDVFFILKALRQIGFDKEVVVITNGEDAINFITKGKTINGQIFSGDVKLVILDLKMPKVDGLEVLKAIRDNEATRHLEVVVLATSDKDPDIARCKELGVNSYIVKPFSAPEFIEAVREVGHYWMTIDKL